MSNNALVHEKSPYLRQHAGNPVNWLPWGEAAFVKAREEDKPLFLSIGYSTCHWCHVMAHESFEDDRTADILNREFVPVKVDREERPDVDRIYMLFVQASTGSGGWPLSVWLTPGLQPFFGGTYFPPDSRYGRPGFRDVLEHLAKAWKAERGRVEQSGQQVTEQLREMSERGAAAGELDADLFAAPFGQFRRMFDARWGGFGSAPKFPRPVVFQYLLRFYASTKNEEASTGRDPAPPDERGTSADLGAGRESVVRASSLEASTGRDPAPPDERGTSADLGAGRESVVRASSLEALEMTVQTLLQMAAGGMHDQLGGGFHRYSVDERWFVPHFEKMLYDQAQLATVYLETFQITRNERLAAVARDIFAYVLRDLRDVSGGFFSAEDADSPDPANPGHSGEGAFYIWSQDEIVRLLGPSRGALFSRRFGVEADGNVRNDPQGEFTGRNILYEATTEEAASERESLVEAKRVLFEARKKRPRPHLDNKVLTAWNGLMISALAKGFAVLGDPAYKSAAEDAVRFILQRMFEPGQTRLLRRFCDGDAAVGGFLDDYAFLAQGLVDLYEVTFNADFLQVAIELADVGFLRFEDVDNGGFYSTSADAPDLLLRMKEDYDGAEPAANAVATDVLLRLAHLTGRQDFERRGTASLRAAAGRLKSQPAASPLLAVALGRWLAAPSLNVFRCEAVDDAVRQRVRAEWKDFAPDVAAIVLDDAAALRLAGVAPFLSSLKRQGRMTLYRCRNFTCELPEVVE